MARLGDVCIINPKNESLADDLPISFIPMQKVSEQGDIDISDIRTYKEVKKGFTLFQNGDVLFAKITPCMENGKGAVADALMNGKGAGSTEFHVLRPNLSIITSEWLYFLTSWGQFRNTCKKHMTGSGGQKRVPKSFLENYEIKIPSIETQNHITNVLQQLNFLISLRKQQLAKLDELVKARFVEICEKNFPMTTADKVCSLIVDCPHSTPKYIGDELVFPAIRTSEIKNGEIEWSSMRYVSRSEYMERTKRLMPESGDIVYAREGTYGDCVILPEGINFCLGQRTMLFRPDRNICTSNYLHQVLRSDAVRRQAEESNAGSTVPHVNLTDAKKFAFPLPPMYIQKQFSEIVCQVDRLKFTIHQNLEKLEILKKSLMQKFFMEENYD